MAMREVDAIGHAIAATENEIAADAWGKEEVVEDETGDRSIEEMGEGLEGQHEPDDDDDELEAEAEGEEESEAGEEAKPKVEEPEGKPEVKAETQPEGRVPPGRLREQTERAKAAEAERDRIKAEFEAEKTNSRKEIDTLKTQFETLMATLRQQPQPKAAEPTPKVAPDLFEQPTEFVNHLTEGFEAKLAQRDQQIEALRVEGSMGIAHARHGDTFSKAFDAVQKLDPRNPDNQVMVRRIMTSQNPGESLVQWHKRSETLSLVGDDPTKFLEQERAKMREGLMKDPEFRKQLMADLRSEAETADGGRPRNVTRLPRSLNGATGNSARSADMAVHDDSDQSVADSAWR